MIGWLLRATCATLVLGALGYLVVAVPIGRRTLFDHGLEISKTKPARELAQDVKQATDGAIARVKDSLEKP